MNSAARAIRIFCLGCIIALSSLPAGVAGLVCQESWMVEDLVAAESTSIHAAPLVTVASGRARGSRGISRSPIASRRVWKHGPQMGWPPRFCFAGHQLANGLNAPLLI